LNESKLDLHMVHGRIDIFYPLIIDFLSIAEYPMQSNQG